MYRLLTVLSTLFAVFAIRRIFCAACIHSLRQQIQHTYTKRLHVQYVSTKYMLYNQGVFRHHLSRTCAIRRVVSALTIIELTLCDSAFAGNVNDNDDGD